VAKPISRRWRCSLCGRSGKAADAMQEFYFHWRTYHDRPTPNDLPKPG